MRIFDINTILFNPIFTSNLIHHFLSGAKTNKIKTELLYFVLPLLYNNKILIKLNKSNSASTIKTLLTDEVKLELINLESQVKSYSKITKEAIILLSNKTNLEIGSFVSLEQSKILHFSIEKDSVLKEYYKSAFYLGLIFSKEDYKSIFYKF